MAHFRRDIWPDIWPEAVKLAELDHAIQLISMVSAAESSPPVPMDLTEMSTLTSVSLQGNILRAPVDSKMLAFLTKLETV